MLRRRPDSRALVATKGGHFRRGDDYVVDASPAALRADCQHSLQALSRDVHDLYYLHRPDPGVPLEESVGALAQLRDEGLVARIGLCNVTVAQLRSAQRVTTIHAVQNHHSILSPAGAELLDVCAAAGIAFFGYSPLAGFGRGTTGPAVRSAASERGVDETSILLAWLLSRAENMHVITGARRLAHLDASLAAADVTLTPDETEKIRAELATSTSVRTT